MICGIKAMQMITIFINQSNFCVYKTQHLKYDGKLPMESGDIT